MNQEKQEKLVEWAAKLSNMLHTAAVMGPPAYRAMLIKTCTEADEFLMSLDEDEDDELARRADDLHAEVAYLRKRCDNLVECCVTAQNERDEARQEIDRLTMVIDALRSR